MAVRSAKWTSLYPFICLFVLIVVGISYLTPLGGPRPIQWSGITRPFSAKLSPEEPIPQEHPIKILHEAALRTFRALVRRQSKTLDEAVAEYKRRYRRHPPPGFDKWYEYAVQENSVIIDDFDMIDEAMEPFWKLKPSLIKQILRRAASGPRLWYFSIRDGHAIPSEDNWMGQAIRDVLGNVTANIPNIEILMNPLDEPRILIAKSPPTETVRWDDHCWTKAAPLITKPCGLLSSMKRPRESRPNVNTLSLPFVTSHYAGLDVCSDATMAQKHGFLMAPYSLVTSTSPVPILSQAAPSTFSDILYPSMWYWQHTMDRFDSSDPVWEEKLNKVYWAGSTTGGFNGHRGADSASWSSHRHRFVEMTRQLGKGVYSCLSQSKADGTEDEPRPKSTWTRYESDEILAELYNTKFTKAVQCREEECERMADYYQVQKAEDAREAFKHKFMMDMDGNSFSGRFYGFLGSRGCAFKQTIFREWHDERLVPWVHYVPISVALDELPETTRYLALTTEGAEIAKRVADEGRDWYHKVLRKQDAAIYLYRLFLEYARVSSEDRDETRL